MTTPELTCQELVELVTDYLEGILAPSEQSRFEAHLDNCDGCQRYLHQMRTVIRLSHRLSEQDLNSPMREHLLEVFRDWKSS